MQLKKCKISLSVSLFFFFSTHLHSNGRDLFSSLTITPSARAAAMGESYVGLAEGAETVFYNPSGLAFHEKKHLYTQSLLPPFIEEIKFNSFLYTHPVSLGAWAVSLGLLHMGGFTKTVADNTIADGFRESGTFSTYDLQFGASYAREVWENVGAGATFRFLRASLADATANGFGFDFGFLYRPENQPFQVGAAIQNIGPKSKFQEDEFDLPTWLRAGFSLHQPREPLVPYIPSGSIFSMELVKPLRGESSIRAGMELPAFKILRFRTGYNHSFKKRELGTKSFLPANLSLGMGIGKEGWQLDYALVSLAELGLAHRISLELKWGER